MRFSVWFRPRHRRYSSIQFDMKTGAVSTSNLSVLLAEMALLTNAEFGMVQELSPVYFLRAEEKGLLQFTDQQKKHGFLSITQESLKDGLPDAFDLMWLPAKAWTVRPKKLLEQGPELFILPERDSATREDALSEIQKMG